MHRVLWVQGGGHPPGTVGAGVRALGEGQDGKANIGAREEGTAVYGETQRRELHGARDNRAPGCTKAGKSPDRDIELRGWRSPKPWKPA